MPSSLRGLPKDVLKTGAMQDELAHFTNLLAGKGDCGGWELTSNAQMVLEHIGRDEDNLYDSTIWPTFTEGHI